MNFPVDQPVLQNIASEVDKSLIKVIFSTQYMKTQALLVDKLNKQSDQARERCGFISNANKQLEADIKHTEQEISSMLLAYDTIKSSNVTIRKDWLLAKDKTPKIKERIESSVKKYEAIWLVCKKRYESIPFVQNYLQATEITQKLKTDIDNLERETQRIYEEIKTRKDVCIELDKKRVIAFAEFMIVELPALTKIINEKQSTVNNLTKKIDELSENIAVIEQNEADGRNDEKLTDNGKNSPRSQVSLIPTLQLTNFECDSLDIDLDSVRKRVETFNTSPPSTEPVVSNLETNKYDKNVEDFIISPYFHKPVQEHFSKRKLINILGDIKIDQQDAYNIISKVNPEKLQAVNVIAPEDGRDTNEKDKTPLATETIEVIDMTITEEENIIIPPTPFLDTAAQGSQEVPSKKTVSFDLPNTVTAPNDDVIMLNESEDNQPNISTNSQLDVSAENEESYTKIKDMIMKKHNLDLSPQFVYAKNTLMTKANDEVTSKFFTHDEKQVDHDKINTEDPAEIPMVVDPGDRQQQEHVISEEKDPKVVAQAMEVDDFIVSSPKQDVIPKGQIRGKPVSGLLFTHGITAIPDSLDVSISTTGYDDSDFPHCIDSSLLLSPKADIPMSEANNEIASQETPNFLSGLRKTGLSFFGAGPSKETNPESNAENQGNSFNFNFGGGEKKSRGGLFNMFR